MTLPYNRLSSLPPIAMRPLRFTILVLALLLGHAHADIPADAQREQLISHVLQNFWGKARLADGKFVQPASAAERATVPVGREIAYRALDSGEVSGLAEWCGLDWRPHYLALTGAARRKGLNDKQVAFVSVLHGTAQGRIASAMAKSAPCGGEERLRVARLIERSQRRGLDGT